MVQIHIDSINGFNFTESPKKVKRIYICIGLTKLTEGDESGIGSTPTTAMVSASRNQTVTMSRDRCFQRLRQCYYILTATCAECYALGRPMSSDHTASTFPVSGGLESNEFREFRRSLSGLSVMSVAISN